MSTADNTPKYWDSEWSKRVRDDGGIEGNIKKVHIILDELVARDSLD